MDLLKGPIQQVGKTTCSWNMSTDPDNWNPEHDCPNRAEFHIMWEDRTMSQVCGEHLTVTIERMTSTTLVSHKFRSQCSQEGSVWLMPANICTQKDNIYNGIR